MVSREGNVLHVPGTGQVAEVKGDEILGAYVGLLQKGGTLKQGQGVLEAGQVLAYETASKKYVKYAGTTDEVQTVTEGGSGLTSFTLTYSGQTTGAIAAGATAADVQTALEALSNIAPGDVTVTGAAGGPYTVTFGGTLADTNVAQMTAIPTGGTGTVTVATTTAGGADSGTGGSETAVGILRQGSDTTDSDMECNIVLGGVVKADKCIGLDAAAKTDLGGRTDAVHGYFIF
jgi:hypothetical protein